VILRALHIPAATIVRRSDSALGGELAARWSAILVTLRDDHGAGFVTVTGQILMAVHSRARPEPALLTAMHTTGLQHAECQKNERSFIETLRHLVFATDAWAGRTILDEPMPYYPFGLPHRLSAP